MEKPWFKLDPNNEKDRWWLYSSIKNTKTALIPKNNNNIICHLIIKYINNQSIKYRILTWFENDPNRYLATIRDENIIELPKKVEDMIEGEIIKTIEDIPFEVYDCKFNKENQNFVCKILERMDDNFYIFF